MSLIELLIYVVAIGLVLHLINNILPGPAWLKTVINVVAGLIVIVWLLEVLGFHSGMHLHLR